MTASLATVVLTVALAVASAEVSDDKKPNIPADSDKAGAAQPQPRMDALGDPLPEGAILRLGTLRFRYGWGINNLLPSPDGKTLVSNEAAGTVSVWDLVTGKLLRQFPGNLQSQRYIALSRDGKFVAICHREAILLWDLASGKEVRRLAQPEAAGVAFSPDGKILAAAGNSADGKDNIHLWDLSSGKKIAKFPWERGNQISPPLLAYTPDGKSLVAGQWFDSKVGLWDAASGKKRHELVAKAGAVFSLALSPDGAVLATGSQQGCIPLWDMKTGQLIRKLQAESRNDYLQSVAFSPDGKRLAAAVLNWVRQNSKDQNCVYIWDVATGKQLSRFQGGSGFHNIVYSRDGKTLIAASDGVIRLLDAATGKEVGATAGSRVYASPVTCSADGSTLAYLRQSDVRSWAAKANRGVNSIELRFWDMKANCEIGSAFECGGSFRCQTFALAPDGRTLAVSDDEYALNLWDVRSGKLLRRLQEGKKGRPDAHILAFSPDGRTLASADSKTASIQLWDAATGKPVRRLPLLKATAAPGGNRRVGASDLAFSPDGRLLAASVGTWADGGRIRIWETATAKELPQLTREMNAPAKEDTPRAPAGADLPKSVYPRLVFSPNGRMLAKSGPSKTLSIWETASGRRRLSLKGHEDSTVCVAFAPDGRTLASASWDNTIRLWDLHSGRQLRKLTGHRGKANSLAFSADGKILVSAGDDTTILFWDVADITGRKNPLTAALGKRQWQALWEDLAADDAAKAYAAMVRMADDAPTTMAALKDRLHPLRPADPERLRQLLKELDSDQFAVRETASRELEKLGDVVGSKVRRMLARPDLALESRRRLESLAASLDEISGARLRSLRAIEVLEMLDTVESRELLKKLAGGVAEALPTTAAQTALKRLRH